MDLKGKSFLKLLDFTPEEIKELIDLSAKLKAEKKAGVNQKKFYNKNVALIFSLQGSPKLTFETPSAVLTPSLFLTISSASRVIIALSLSALIVIVKVSI